MRNRGFPSLRTIRRILLELLVVGAVTTIIAGLAYRLRAQSLFHALSFEDILAVFAIWFAIVHFVDSRYQEREINRIVQSMSTRFVGLFPKNLEQIIKTVSRARRHTYIIVDYVGYAQYSAPRLYDEYVKALKDAAGRGVTVRIACYDDGLADKAMKVQFPDGDELFKKERSRVRFQDYFKYKKGLDQPTTMEGLADS